MSTKRLLLSLAVASALATSSAHAIYLNTDAFRAAGGDPNNIAATYDRGTLARLGRSWQAPFDSVGWLGNCTGTWLGNDANNTWILTARHCVTEGWGNRSFTAPSASVSGWSRAYLAPRQADGNAWDIALIQMPLKHFNTTTKPMLYDGNAEVGRTVHMVGLGTRGVGHKGNGLGRMWGTTKVVGAFANDGALVSDYQPSGNTELQVRGAPGDSGSAAWQQHAGGYWSIIGVLSTIGDYKSNHTRMNRHVEWIKRLYPGATTLSDHFTVTQSRAFVSRNHAEDVAHGTVYYVIAPKQPKVQGPTAGAWIGQRTHSTITVIARDAISGAERPVKLYAWRNAGGCGNYRMEDAVICGSLAKSGPLTVQYVPAANASLPSGEWKAKLEVDVIGWHRPYKERLPLNLDIRNTTQGRVLRNSSWTSPNFASAAAGGTVYYIVPKQGGASGPTSGIWGGPTQHGRMQVLVREATTGFERTVALRTTRNDGCFARQMHDAQSCYGMKMGPLTVSYDAAENWHLPSGRWRGVAYVRAKGWHDPAVDEAIRIDVEIEQ